MGTASFLRRFLRDTASTSPTHKYTMTTLDPPAEKNGNVTPMTGSTCKFIPRLMMHCQNSAAKMPTHR